MAANEIHKSDTTTIRRVMYDGDDIVDISSATVKQIKLYKPSGTVVTKTASFTTDGTDGKLEYTCTTSDLDEVGTWQSQVYLEMSGWTGHSDKQTFQVYDNL